MTEDLFTVLGEQQLTNKYFGQYWTKTQTELVEEICKSYCNGTKKIPMRDYRALLYDIQSNTALREARGMVTKASAVRMVRKLGYRCYTARKRKSVKKTNANNLQMPEYSLGIIKGDRLLCSFEITKDEVDRLKNVMTARSEKD